MGVWWGIEVHGVIHGCMVMYKGVWGCIEAYGEVLRCMVL